MDMQEPNKDSIHNNNNNLLVDLDITCILAILVEWRNVNVSDSRPRYSIFHLCQFQINIIFPLNKGMD